MHVIADLSRRDLLERGNHSERKKRVKNTLEYLPRPIRSPRHFVIRHHTQRPNPDNQSEPTTPPRSRLEQTEHGRAEGADRHRTAPHGGALAPPRPDRAVGSVGFSVVVDNILLEVVVVQGPVRRGRRHGFLIGYRVRSECSLGSQKAGGGAQCARVARGGIEEIVRDGFVVTR